MSAVITKKPVSARSQGANRLYRTDSKGNKVVLHGVDHNRELLRLRALERAEDSSLRADAASVSIEQDLWERDQKIWEIERAPLTAAQFVPMDPGAAAYADADKYQWLQKNMRSDALLKANLSGAGHDVPSVNASMVSQLEDIWNVMSSYELTLQQQQYSPRLKFNFGAEFAIECRKAIDRAIDKALLLGDSELGIEGFYGLTGVDSVTLTTGTWYEGGATPDQILFDFKEIMDSIRDSIASSSVASAPNPDSVIMSDRVFAYLNQSKTFSIAGYESMMDLLKRRFPEITNWEFSYELRDQGASGTDFDKVVVYKRDPNFVKAAIPVPYQERPVLIQAYSEVVHAFARFVPCVLHDSRPMRYAEVRAVAA